MSITYSPPQNILNRPLRGPEKFTVIFSAKKFKVLKKYLRKHDLKGGFVRYDKRSAELFICTENYSDDINSDGWSLLREYI